MESLIIPAFVAGILTFLAPCTLPLVPGYLGFISGVSLDNLKNAKNRSIARRKVFFNGVLYVVGFSLIFILMGTVFAAGGVALAEYRVWLARIGGVFVIFFGLYMMHLVQIPLFTQRRSVSFSKWLKPGKPYSSFFFGVAFGIGWSPCVGPILGAVLTLAATTATVGQGAVLLSVFSLGLAIPFLLIAFSVGHASQYIKKITKYLNIISVIGGVFLVFLGILLVTDNLVVWNSFFYQSLEFINYDALLDYL